MCNTLYPICQSWVHAFTSHLFTAGMQSTQRIESINVIVHKAILIMAEVVKFLDSKQMCESVLYKCEMITLENAIIFNDDQMDV